MRYSFLLVMLFSFVVLQSCAQEIPNKEEQIAGALMAVPEESREGATVLGYDTEGNVLTLKQGTNDMICLADNPNKPGFNAAAYHKDLEPFMKRGRELAAEGKGYQEKFEIRGQEVEAGTLKMPTQATTLHILAGSDGKYNSETKTVEGANYRYVVYIPFATPESTGLPTKPVVPGGPWIMDPGTYRAHIMITPPVEE